MKKVQNDKVNQPTGSRSGRIRRAINKRVKRTLSATTNNILINNVAIRTGMETRLKRIQHPYIKFIPGEAKSDQENAGFSDRPEINAAVQKTHSDLERVSRMLRPREGKHRVLDIGCGPGLYLKEFSPQKFDAVGIDINDGMRELARKNAPHAQIIAGDIVGTPIDGKFDLAYSIGVFIYIGRSEVSRFFDKVANLLNPSGYFFLNYQHALSLWDLMYPDLTYIQYSPKLVERLASKRLAIVEHGHAFDDRSIGLYDRQPYKSLNPQTKKTFRNSSVILLQKEN